MSKIYLKPETIQAIEKILNKGELAEVKIEHGKAEVIAIRRKKIEIHTSKNS